MKVENRKLRWNITCDNDGISQLTLTWRTPGVNMSVTHSVYKKTPSQKRRDSQRKHDYYVERQNNKHCTTIGTMTDNIDFKMQHVKKIKCTSQETQTEQVSEKHIPVGLCTCSKRKKSDIEMMRNSPTEARNIMETP